MGSAWKRFSRRSVALPVILMFFVLLFVAGAAMKLHHKNPNVDHTGSLLARKMLRIKLTGEGEPNLSMLRRDEDHHSRSRPPSASQQQQPLPRGIVQDKSNLEMESMVGNPERRHDEHKPKSLLAVPVGIKNKAAVDKLVSKFPASDFAVMLFHYDGAMEQWSDLDWHARAVHVSAPGQTKWWFAKRFLHPDVVADYDYVFLWDEDIEVDAFDPLRYLAIVKKEGLDISQPALERGSEIHHGITARALGPKSGDVHRRFYRPAGPRCDDDSTAPPCTGWVEMMVLVFSRAAWRCTWGMIQNDLVHAWGLDYKLGYCAQGDRTLKVGVVDSEYVFHRGVPVLGGGGGGGSKTSTAIRAAVRRRSHVEMMIFDRRWKEAVAEDVLWTDPYPEGQNRRPRSR